MHIPSLVKIKPNAHLQGASPTSLDAKSIKSVVKLCYISIVLMLFSTLSMAEEECIFDDSVFDKDWINDHSELKKNYVWDDDKHEFGIVLNPNTFINVSGGGCVHYGERYRMFVVKADENLRTTAWYKQQLLLLSKLVYNEKQHKEFKQELSAVKIPLASVKSGEMFLYESSPSVSINDKSSVVEFEIFWSIN